MVLVHDLRGNILPEAVDDAVHEGVFAQQRDTAGLAVEHGKLLREEFRYVKALWLFYSGFIRNLHLNDAVNAELCDLLPVIVETDEIVCIVIPKQGIRGNEVYPSVVPVDALLGGRVIEVAEGDFPSLCNGGLDAVYADVDAFVDGFYAAVNVQMPFQQCGVSGSDKGRQPLDQLLALSRRDEPSRLYRVNEELAEAGAAWERCTITRSMIAQNGGRLISDDPRQSAKTYACAAAEARVLGIDKAAMSITGSGTHGIICTLPLDAYCKVQGLGEERLLRATAISYLVCMYIKEFSGKLSAFCGCGIAGGTGLACALAYLMGGDKASLDRACNNMAASITGMICTGGNHCCCLKVITAVDCAYNAAVLSVDNAAVAAPHGLCDHSVEKTLQNVGLIADPGMVDTERVIVEIMKNK